MTKEEITNLDLVVKVVEANREAISALTTRIDKQEESLTNHEKGCVERNVRVDKKLDNLTDNQHELNVNFAVMMKTQESQGATLNRVMTAIESLHATDKEIIKPTVSKKTHPVWNVISNITSSNIKLAIVGAILVAVVALPAGVTIAGAIASLFGG